MNQKGFTPIIILVVILFVVAVGGAYYLGTQTKGTVTLSQVPASHQSPGTYNLSPSSNPTVPVTPDQIIWKRASFSGYSFEYPYGWHVADLWTIGPDHAITTIINPSPINTAPRDGPLGAIAIYDWSGSQTPNDKLISEITQDKDGLESGYKEETLQTEIGSIDHIQGKLNSIQLQGTQVEYYLLLLGASDNIHKQVIEVSTLNNATSSDILWHIVQSIKKI